MAPRTIGLVLGILLLVAGPARADRRLFTIVMCDTNAERVEATVKSCADTFLGMVRALKDQGIACVEPEYIDGDTIGLDEVARRIQTMALDQNDTLLCYYVGHGAAINRVHYLMTSRGKIGRGDLVDVLTSTPRVRPRLTILATECCANEIGRRGLSLVPSFAGLSLSEPVPDRSLLENLLFEHSGLVNFTSSSYDETTIGGIFSTSLRYHFESAANFSFYDTNRDGFVGWHEFFPRVAFTTNARFQQVKRDALEAGEQLDPALKRQQNQMPYAYTLGTSKHEQGVERFAPNFGLYYEIVPADFAYAAKVTRTALPGTPAGRIGLETGDLISKIDDLPIWMDMDVLNHHSRTNVLFRNVRTGQQELRTTDLPAFTRYPPGVPTEYFARNFGMYYQLMPFGNTFGARLTRMPTANSPLRAIQLEPGDMLVLIDGQRIRNTQDVLAHVQRTELLFINVRTGLPQRAFVTLP